MLYIGTKIVVIGSNVKRKAGPRVGSVGFITNIMPNNKMANFGNILVCEAYVLFIRYGFQEQQRYELKRVMAAIPRMDKSSWKMTEVMREIRKTVKMDTTLRLPLLMLSPSMEVTEKDLQYKVHSYLCSNMRYKLQNIAYLNNTKTFPNTERLRATLSNEATTLLRVSTTNIKPNQLNLLLSNIFEKNTHVLKEILELVLKLDALHSIVAQQDKRFKDPNSSSAVCCNLFKPYEFNKYVTEYSKYAPPELIAFYTELSRSYVMEGIKVLNKHA